MSIVSLQNVGIICGIFGDLPPVPSRALSHIYARLHKIIQKYNKSISFISQYPILPSPPLPLHQRKMGTEQILRFANFAPSPFCFFRQLILCESISILQKRPLQTTLISAPLSSLRCSILSRNLASNPCQISTSSTECHNSI